MTIPSVPPPAGAQTYKDPWKWTYVISTGSFCNKM